METTLHNFEAGRRGKPDEIDTIIAHSLSAHFLEVDRSSRFNVRVNGRYDKIREKYVVDLGGEFSIRSGMIDPLELQNIVVREFNTINQTSFEAGREIEVHSLFNEQSPALASNGKRKKIGDSGLAIAVADRYGPNHLPWERSLAVGLRDLFDQIYANGGKVPLAIAKESGVLELIGLRPDGKIDICALYDRARFHSLSDVVIALEHEESLPVEILRSKATAIARAYFKGGSLDINYKNVPLTINGADAFNGGGWKSDAGSNEAKPQRDGFASHGVTEDSFSGEDPSKPGFTYTAAARYLAKHIVRSQVADYAKVKIRYVIGEGAPRGVYVETEGTGGRSNAKLSTWASKALDLRSAAIIERFSLRDPCLYHSMARDSDMFHSQKLPWNLECPSLLASVPQRFAKEMWFPYFP